MEETESSAKKSTQNSSTPDIDSPLEVEVVQEESQPEREVNLSGEVSDASIAEFQSAINLSGIISSEDRKQAEFVLNYLATEVPRERVIERVRQLVLEMGQPGMLETTLDRLYRYAVIKNSIKDSTKSLERLKNGGKN